MNEKVVKLKNGEVTIIKPRAGARNKAIVESEKDGVIRESLMKINLLPYCIGDHPWGTRPIRESLDSLDCDLQIIVVCGKNKRLYEWFIKNKAKFKKPIFIFEYIEYIHKIMDFPDIIITKGGGITISEALAKGLCIIVTSPIPGQEERNVEHLLEKKAIVKVDQADKIGGVVGDILRDKKKMYFLRERAKEVSIIDSSLRIVDLILEMIS